MRLWIDRGLAAWLIGLLLCPAGYVALGALARFAPALALVIGPPVLLSTAYLLVRCLSGPAAAPAAAWHGVAEAMSWLCVLGFLVVVSGFGLHTRYERMTLTVTLHLGCWLLALPVVVLRGRTRLLDRMARLPQAVALAALAALVMWALACAAAYGLRPAAFPG